jgi:hypothetical protein
MRKSILKKYKLSLQTNNSIKEIITIIILTVATVATPYITAADKNHIALYIIKKDITYRNILGRNKKSLKQNLKISLRTASKSK